MAFLSVTVKDVREDILYSIPVGRYTYTDAQSMGYNTSVYEPEDLETYQKLMFKVCHRMGLEVNERVNLFFVYGPEKYPSTSYIQVHRMNDVNGVLEYYRLTPNITQSPEGIPEYDGSWVDVYDVTHPDYIWSIRNAYRTNGVRLMTESTGIKLSDYIHYYSVGTSLTDDNNASYLFYYDKDQGYFGANSVGSIQAASDYRRVIANPMYMVRRPSGGLKIFELSQEYDPLADGGYSDSAIPDGDFDDESDEMDFADLPSISAVDTGFISLYNPTVSELRALADYMWSPAFSLDSFKKLFADPMDCILGLSIVPVDVPSGPQADVKVGNISTGVMMTRAASQHVVVDCGTLNLREYWGSALDYAPNSKITLYLPYIGFRPVDVDEVMNNPIHIRYNVDVLTGSCVAEVMTLTSDGRHMIAYTFEGNCAVQVPVTGADYSNMLSMSVKALGTLVAASVTGGASSAVQAGAVAGGLTNTVNGVMNSKPSVQHSGSVSGGGGQMSQQVPYFILERPRQSLPSGYQQIEGYPANITRQLGSLSGFTQVDNLHLENIPATDSELAEIEALLKSGVIL